MTDDIKILNILYTYCVNSLPGYVINAGVYYDSAKEQKEGEKFLNDLIKSLNNIASAIEDYGVEHKITFTPESYDPKYTDLNYLSYKFLKGYIEEKLDIQRNLLLNEVKNLKISDEVQNLVNSF